jgi:hypothetical protein
MRRSVLGAAVLPLVLGVSFSISRGEGDDAALPQKRAAAIEKGVTWLKKAQAADGSWDDKFEPFTGMGHMKQGSTALAALALLKSGVAPDDPCIQHAFDFMAAARLERVYSAGCVLMALEARYNWAPPVLDDQSSGTVERKGAKDGKPAKPSPKDLDLAQKCVQFLTRNQARHGWNYPPAGSACNEDLSNTQYALLGLDAAERLGIEAPKDVYERAQDLLVASQERDGADVAPFPVPGGDLSYKELKKVEKETRDALKKVEGSFKGKKEGETNGAGHTEEDERRSTEQDATKKIFRTVSSKDRMKARGWGYAMIRLDAASGTTSAPRSGGSKADTQATGSMTTAGLACLFICKAHLDGTANYEKSLKGPIDHALRDGAAWMAKNFAVDCNPSGPAHLFYYLYGLERAGVLLLVPKFGDHDWYDEGSREILKDQAGDGSWDAGGSGTVGPMCDTCFALLFLARGTTPMVRIPTRTATGPGGDAPKPEGGPGK